MHREKMFGKKIRNASCFSCNKPMPIIENSIDVDELNDIFKGDKLVIYPDGSMHTKLHGVKRKQKVEFCSANEVKK
jgi:hypothetical protein